MTRGKNVSKIGQSTSGELRKVLRYVASDGSGEEIDGATNLLGQEDMSKNTIGEQAEGLEEVTDTVSSYTNYSSFLVSSLSLSLMFAHFLYSE